MGTFPAQYTGWPKLAGRSERAGGTPSLGKEGRIVCEQLVRRHLNEPGGREEVIAAFADLFDHTVYDFGLMIGPKGICAVLERALQAVRRDQPLLGLVRVSDHAVHLDRLQTADAEVAAITAALTDLFITAMDVIASLIGFDLVLPIMRRFEHTAEVRNA